MIHIGDLRLTKPARAKANKLGEVERVYRLLRDWLITAKLPPGEFLSEADLAERCGTSRTPVREACTRLMQDHWLTRIRRKGFMVTPISVRDIVDLYDYRKLLECYAAEKVAQGVKYVLVNGQLEWEDGKLTGATAGRVLRGNH